MIKCDLYNKFCHLNDFLCCLMFQYEQIHTTFRCIRTINKITYILHMPYTSNARNSFQCMYVSTNRISFSHTINVLHYHQPFVTNVHFSDFIRKYCVRYFMCGVWCMWNVEADNKEPSQNNGFQNKRFRLIWWKFAVQCCLHGGPIHCLLLILIFYIR